jgi:hypothetical protein
MATPDPAPAPRRRRIRRALNLTADPAVRARVSALSEAAGLPVSRVVDQALEAALPGLVAALPEHRRPLYLAALERLTAESEAG